MGSLVNAKDVDNLLKEENFTNFRRELSKEISYLHKILGDLVCYNTLVGNEIEVSLLKKDLTPAIGSSPLILEEMDDPNYGPEIGSWQVEIHLPPIEVKKGLAREMYGKIKSMMEKLKKFCEKKGYLLGLTGSLETLRLEHLLQENSMYPNVRYYALDRRIRELRGGKLLIDIDALGRMKFETDTFMLEACNTSSQPHIQAKDEKECAEYMNASIVLAGPLVEMTANAPFMIGKLLGHEVRILNLENITDHRKERNNKEPKRAPLSHGYYNGGIGEFYVNACMFPVLIPAIPKTNGIQPREITAATVIESLSASLLQAGTYWPWVRPVVGKEPTPHIRTEFRPLTCGPSIKNIVANSLLYYGSVRNFVEEKINVKSMEFEKAEENFYKAVKFPPDEGTEMWWFRNGEVRKINVYDVMYDVLERAKEGLRAFGLVEWEIKDYMSKTIEENIEEGTPSMRKINLYHELIENGMSNDETLFEIVRRMVIYNGN